MDKENNLENWPLSNYSIFLALILLVASAVRLSTGDERMAQDFAVYVYYFIILGVVIRFLEFTLPENTKSRVINCIENFLKEYRKIELKIKINLRGPLKRTGMNHKTFPEERIEIKPLIDVLRKRIDDRYFHIIIFLSISSFIWLSFDKNYILLLDMIFPVKNSFDFYFSYPTPILYSTSWVMQRIYLLFSMFLSGYSMYGLSYKISQLRMVSIYAGLLYMINPYIYIRIMTGHLYILLSYAILPLLLKTFIDFLDKKGTKEMIKFIFVLTFVAFSSHILIMALIMMSTIFLYWCNKYRDITISKMIELSIILFVILNLYWIMPVLTAKDWTFNNINDEDFKIFAPKIDNISDLFNVASMYGFWREDYIYAKDFIPNWQLLSLFIILLTIYGFISFYRDEKIGYIVKALGIIWIIGFILATGINGPFGDLNHWLYDNTILKGFRDSHKFVSMIVLSYAVLGGLGISKLDTLSKENDTKLD